MLAVGGPLTLKVVLVTVRRPPVSVAENSTTTLPAALGKRTAVAPLVALVKVAIAAPRVIVHA